MPFAPSVTHLLDADGLPLFSLKEINALAKQEKERIYATLVPDIVFERYGFDRDSYLSPDGRERIRFICPKGLGLLRIAVRRQPEDDDDLFFVEVADTPFRQMEFSFCLINDPDAPRFNVDCDSSGRENMFGTLRRNIAEEIRAMHAGLTPNQVRSGLNTFKSFFERFERFVSSLGIDMIVAEPLSYNNAIHYERYGFDYITGKQLMLWIDREFQPGGVLYQRLDGSTTVSPTGNGENRTRTQLGHSRRHSPTTLGWHQNL